MKKADFDKALTELARDGYVTIKYDPEQPYNPQVIITQKALDFLHKVNPKYDEYQ